ncbi:MAG: NBR1-Ig-like domain-containing protein [Candidatus Promineifilaceae bacterium]
MELSRFEMPSVGELLSLRLLGVVSVCLLAFSLPFELERPLVVIGAFRLTNVELLLFITLFLSVVIVVKERRWHHPGWLKVPISWLILLGLFGMALVVSAYLAPEFRLNALKAAFRTVSGLALAFALPQLFKEKGYLPFLIGSLLAGGLLSVGIGLAEIWLGQTVSVLNLFRNEPTVAGPFVRLSGSFNHANQMAMFIEATLPFLAATAWLIGRKGHRIMALLGGLVLLLYLQADFLTYSRSSFVTIFLSATIVAGLVWWWQPNKRRLAYLWGAIAGLVLLLFIVNTLINPVLRLRLSSEGDNEWYNASFVVPEQLELEAGNTIPVTITVSNEGSLYWSSQGETPINLGGHWYRVSDDARSDNEARWSLDQNVAPGESLQMTVMLTAPNEAGEYQFEWDLVQEGVVWFSLRNGRHFTSYVTVLGAVGTPTVEREPDTFSNARPTAHPIPNRRVLWSIAARQFLERSLLGIGLDNFRLTYGEVMGWQSWNNSIHTNNWYIETVVSVGLLGSVPFFSWLVLLGLGLLDRIRRSRVNIWQIALICGLLAYLIHGLLDYFLLFNGTGLLFWIFVGMWMVLAWSKPSA